MFLRAHLDDVCSDLSVFHRVDDVLALDAVTFWKLAWRLPAYQGRMAVVVQELQERENPAPDRAPAYGPAAGSARQAPVQGTAATLRTHPEFAAGGNFAPLFEVVEVKAPPSS
ncbi:hypothetical protein [Actinoallomurus sp. NPDC052274]|uniref:hypothetical protein n=1 Tax=Actinoallomurus sp. NPDC052274 TaxID=3155420 RepID=UPI00341CFBD3